MRLGAHDGEAGFGMRELLDAVRRDGAAGVEIRVDERCQHRRRFDGRIERHPQLTEKREVGPESRRDDDPVHFQAEGSPGQRCRSEEHTSELQTLMSTSYDSFCLKKKNA